MTQTTVAEAGAARRKYFRLPPSAFRPGTAHRIRVRLLVSYRVMIGLPGLAWAVTASMTSTLRATYTHTVNVVDALSTDVVLRSKLMDDEETGLRGYLLTGQPIFLQPYAAARASLPALRRRTEALALSMERMRRPLARQRALSTTIGSTLHDLARGAGHRAHLPPACQRVRHQTGRPGTVHCHRARHQPVLVHERDAATPLRDHRDGLPTHPR